MVGKDEGKPHESTRKLNHSALDEERRASTGAYRTVLQDKVKNFHCNLGTLNCEFGLEQRRRWCVSRGLLRKEHRHLVANLFQTLPTAEEFGESTQMQDTGDDNGAEEECATSSWKQQLHHHLDAGGSLTGREEQWLKNVYHDSSQHALMQLHSRRESPMPEMETNTRKFPIQSQSISAVQSRCDQNFNVANCTVSSEL